MDVSKPQKARNLKSQNPEAKIRSLNWHTKEKLSTGKRAIAWQHTACTHSTLLLVAALPPRDVCLVLHLGFHITQKTPWILPKLSSDRVAMIVVAEQTDVLIAWLKLQCCSSSIRLYDYSNIYIYRNMYVYVLYIHIHMYVLQVFQCCRVNPKKICQQMFVLTVFLYKPWIICKKDVHLT